MWVMTQIISWLESAQENLLNAYKVVSDWVWPFSLLATPLYWIYTAFWNLTLYFSQFNEWLSWADGQLDNIPSYANIQSYFQSYFTAASNAWTWVGNAASNVRQITDSWWSSKQAVVQSWIADAISLANTLPSEITAWLAALQTAWTSFAPKIPAIDGIIAWWGNWWGNILTQLGTWWNSRLLEIQGLIDSAFVARQSLWAGWQDWRAKVTEFFTDPDDWLYKSVDRIIERYW